MSKFIEGESVVVAKSGKRGTVEEIDGDMYWVGLNEGGSSRFYEVELDSEDEI